MYWYVTLRTGTLLYVLLRCVTCWDITLCTARPMLLYVLVHYCMYCYVTLTWLYVLLRNFMCWDITLCIATLLYVLGHY